MAEQTTEFEFAAKVDWEGGVEAAMEYGLQSSELPDGELKDAWVEVEKYWSDYADAADRAWNVVQDILEAGDGDSESA